MKKQAIALFAAILVTSLNSQADSYYCKLRNVPAVKAALAKALQAVNAKKEDVKPSGRVHQLRISGMGDAFNFWGTDMLVYDLDGLAEDNRLSVAVRVEYSSLMAKGYVQSSGNASETFRCIDTGVVNPDVIYIDGSDSKMKATPVLL